MDVLWSEKPLLQLDIDISFDYYINIYRFAKQTLSCYVTTISGALTIYHFLYICKVSTILLHVFFMKLDTLRYNTI